MQEELAGRRRLREKLNEHHHQNNIN